MLNVTSLVTGHWSLHPSVSADFGEALRADTSRPDSRALAGAQSHLFGADLEEALPHNPDNFLFNEQFYWFVDSQVNKNRLSIRGEK